MSQNPQHPLQSRFQSIVNKPASAAKTTAPLIERKDVERNKMKGLLLAAFVGATVSMCVLMGQFLSEKTAEKGIVTLNVSVLLLSCYKIIS